MLSSFQQHREKGKLGKVYKYFFFTLFFIDIRLFVDPLSFHLAI